MYKLKNEKLEKESGITLIALVITIIVLLILAGISIAMLTGPNGLLTQADEARTSTDRAGAREKVQIKVLGSYGTDGNLDLEELNDNLLNIPGIKKHIKDGEDTEITKDNQIEGLPAEVVVDGYIFEISDVGVVTEKGEGSDPTPPPPAGDEVTVGEIVEGSNKTYTDGTDTAVIPVGFAIVPGCEDISEGLVISDKENDTTDEGNQFVWIPVKSAEDYKATTTYAVTDVSANLQNDIGYLPLTNVEIGIEDTADDEQKRQLTLNKETELVTKEGVKGFYISRYEAGDGSVEVARTVGSSTTGKLVSKKDAYVYNWISQTDAKEKAKEFTGEDNASVKSGLCTGIQWDMVIAFVNEKNDGAEPPQKFYVTQSSSTRHTGNLATSGQNEADKICNIYDLEGNCYEYVAEKNTYYTSTPYVTRGSDYIDNNSASNRFSPDGNAYVNSSFRFVLYVM